MGDVIKANISDLTPDPRNANKGTQRGRGMLDQSLRQYGAGRSILLDKHNRIIAGNKTTEAAADIGLNDVVIVESDGTQLVAVKRTDLDLDDNAARELAYADNRVAQVDLDWDAAQMLQDAAAGVDLDKFFLKDELDEMLGRAVAGDADAEPQIDRAAELNEKWQVQRGDLFRIGEHRLLCGDSTDAGDVARLLNGEHVDLNFSDPPYGIKRDEGFEGFEGFGGFGPPIARRHYSDDWDGERPTKEQFDLMLSCADNSIFWGGNFFADMLPASTHWIVWDKNNTMPTFGDCELAWTSFKRKSVKKYEITYNGLIGKEKERYHPTQKPLKLYDACLSDYSSVGECIADFYVGSGTTLVACQNLQRKCRAIEISPNYCAVILERMATAFPGIEIERLVP